jgi:hypothetical protein
MPGSCTQDGNPCDNDSNCCTRMCLDLGSGAKVCQPASGCRMTGDYCDKTQACCGGSPDALHPESNPYGVFCDTTGRDNKAPRNDGSTKDDFRCSGGTACNPPGNICGGSGAVNASQNCCDGKKDVCKPDSNGIWRCFGGCPNNDCSACPTGYDANDPACCIPPGPGPESVCQFRDQCCGGAPCVPDASGVLRCTASAPTCKPSGTACEGADDLSCCAPNTCRDEDGDGAFHCGTPTGACGATGATCDGAEDCCSTLCVGTKCVACVPNGESCQEGAQCCSGTCDEGACVAACVPPTGACTVDGDCCAGSICNVPLGATSGTCGAPACGAEGEACNSEMPCCAGTCYAPEFAPCEGAMSGCFCGE